MVTRRRATYKWVLANRNVRLTLSGIFAHDLYLLVIGSASNQSVESTECEISVTHVAADGQVRLCKCEHSGTGSPPSKLRH